LLGAWPLPSNSLVARKQEQFTFIRSQSVSPSIFEHGTSLSLNLFVVLDTKRIQTRSNVIERCPQGGHLIHIRFEHCQLCIAMWSGTIAEVGRCGQHDEEPRTFERMLAEPLEDKIHLLH